MENSPRSPPPTASTPNPDIQQLLDRISALEASLPRAPSPSREAPPPPAATATNLANDPGFLASIANALRSLPAPTPANPAPPAAPAAPVEPPQLPQPIAAALASLPPPSAIFSAAAPPPTVPPMPPTYWRSDPLSASSFTPPAASSSAPAASSSAAAFSLTNAPPPDDRTSSHHYASTSGHPNRHNKAPLFNVWNPTTTIDSWALDVTYYLLEQRINPQNREAALAVIRCITPDGARNAVQLQDQRTTFTSLNAVIAFLRTLAPVSNPGLKARIDIDQLTQTGDVGHYTGMFRSLMSKIANRSDEDHCYAFVRGLQTDLRKEVFARFATFATLEEIITFANNYHQGRAQASWINKSGSFHPSRSSQPFRSSSVPADDPMDTSASLSLPLPEGVRSTAPNHIALQRIKEQRCPECGSHDHQKRWCKQLAKKLQQRARGRSPFRQDRSSSSRPSSRSPHRPSSSANAAEQRGRSPHRPDARSSNRSDSRHPDTSNFRSTNSNFRSNNSNFRHSSPHPRSQQQHRSKSPAHSFRSSSSGRQ